MWISKRLSKSTETQRAERGLVTISSPSGIEAGASVNIRNIETYLPYGFSSLAPTGEEIIIIPSSNGHISTGVKANLRDLEAGEIRLSSAGGASIVLKNDGSIIINGRLTISKEGEINS